MSGQKWAEEVLNRLDSSQFTFTAPNFEDRVRDRKLALEIIAAALVEAEARGRHQAMPLAMQNRDSVIDQARAEGERIGLDKAAKANCVNCERGVPLSKGTFLNGIPKDHVGPLPRCDSFHIRALRGKP